jgi:hypothetical protein
MIKPPEIPDELAKRRAEKKGGKGPTAQERKANAEHLGLLISHGARMRRSAKPKVRPTISGVPVKISFDDEGNKK